MATRLRYRGDRKSRSDARLRGFASNGAAKRRKNRKKKEETNEARGEEYHCVNIIRRRFYPSR